MSTLVEELVARHQISDGEGMLDEVRAMGSAAVEPLILSLQKEHGIGRVLAAQLLARVGDHRAVGPLIEALFEDRSYWSDRLAGRRGVVGRFLNFLDRKQHRELHAAELGLVRRHCAFALGELGDPRAIEPLRRLLDDPDERVRNAARDALVKLKAAEAG